MTRLFTIFDASVICVSSETSSKRPQLKNIYQPNVEAVFFCFQRVWKASGLNKITLTILTVT